MMKNRHESMVVGRSRVGGDDGSWVPAQRPTTDD
jgi:hypothetical protein